MNGVVSTFLLHTQPPKVQEILKIIPFKVIDNRRMKTTPPCLFPLTILNVHCREQPPAKCVERATDFLGVHAFGGRHLGQYRAKRTKRVDREHPTSQLQRERKGICPTMWHTSLPYFLRRTGQLPLDQPRKKQYSLERKCPCMLHPKQGLYRT